MSVGKIKELIKYCSDCLNWGRNYECKLEHDNLDGDCKHFNGRSEEQINAFNKRLGIGK